MLVAGAVIWRFLKPASLLVVMAGLVGCGVTRLEDVMARQPSLVDPPGDLTMAPAVGRQAVANSGSLENSPSEDQHPEPGGSDVALVAAETPVLAAQQNATLFTEAVPWQGFHSIDGYDVMDASGTLCSGRLMRGADRMAKGQQVPLACSDGGTANLKITKITAGGATGRIIIGKTEQTVAITESHVGPQGL